MTALTTSFADLLKPGFRDIAFQKFNEHSPEYPKIVNVLTSSRAYEEDSYVSGLGLVPSKNESVGIAYDDPIQGFDKRYTHTTYGLGVRLTREMFEDDLYGPMRRMVEALGRSMRVSIEQDVANIYNNAFDSTYTGGDGKELCATDHPLLGGGTEQNELTNAADLNETSLEQAYIDIGDMTDDRGLQMALVPRKLLHRHDNMVQVKKLLMSVQDPFNGNNAINPFQNALEPVMNHYLTDVDAWFILADMHGVNHFFRRMPDFDTDNDFDTEDMKFKGTARWSNGWSGDGGGWRGIFGSPGV